MKIRIHNPIYGVPITYLGCHCNNQFKIVGRSGDIDWARTDCRFFREPEQCKVIKYKKSDKTWRVQNPYFINNDLPETIYFRIFIRNENKNT